MDEARVVFAAAALASGVADLDRATGDGIEISAKEWVACLGGVPSGGSGARLARLDDDDDVVDGVGTRLREVSANADCRRRYKWMK